MITLSICIATYNRAGFIAQTLRSIIDQLDARAELLVVDGASPDQTADVVGQLFANRPDCRYIRLDQKGGVDKDYATAVELARGQYCWLMTDDDILMPGAIARVLDALAQRPDLLVVNAQIADHKLDRTLVERKLSAADDRGFAPGELDALFAFTADLLTFIGATVIRRDLWLSRDAGRYFGTEFVHVGVIFQAPLPGPAQVIAQPLVRIRYANAQWSVRAFDVWMFRWPALVWSFDHIAPDARQAVYPREPWRQFGRLLDFKARGVFTLACYRKYLAAQPMPLGYRLRSLFLAAFPDRLFNRFASWWFNPRRRPDAHMTRLELQRSPFARRPDRA